MPDPEQQARIEIDRQLIAAGWALQDKKAFSSAETVGVAVRDFAIPGAGEADFTSSHFASAPIVLVDCNHATDKAGLQICPVLGTIEGGVA